MYVDAHAHIDDKDFDKDRDEVINRAREVKIVTNGTHPDSNRFVLDLTSKYSNLYCALGLYPLAVVVDELKDYPNDFGKFNVDQEIDWIDKNLGGKAIAVGEIGLDFAYHDDSNKKQEKAFRKLINIAKKHNVPVIVHSRKAEQKVIEVMEEEGVKKVILHFFSGSKKLVKRAADNGWYFSIPCNVNRSSQFQMIVREVSINQLLTETDCPYGGPAKGERNEPVNVKYTIREIAKIKGLDEAETKMIIFKNFNDLF